MYAIVYRTDGFPICRQIPGIEPDPVVTWNTEDAAKAFISSKGGEADFEPVQLTDDAMDKLAAAMGCVAGSVARSRTGFGHSSIARSIPAIAAASRAFSASVYARLLLIHAASAPAHHRLRPHSRVTA